MRLEGEGNFEEGEETEEGFTKQHITRKITQREKVRK